MTDEILTPDTTAPAPAAVPEPAAPPAEPATRRDTIVAALENRAEPSQEGAQRPRDEVGRFAKGEAPKAVEPPKEAPKAREYPKSWRAEYRPKWERLAADPELATLQEEIERRESDFHKGIEQYKTDAQFAQQFREAVRPFEATWTARGVDPIRATQMMLAADHVLRHGTQAEKYRAVQTLAQDYGIDLGALSQPGQQPAQETPELAALRQELQQLRQHVSAQQQYVTQQVGAGLATEIETFAKDHKHFEAVRERMGQLIQSGAADSLQTAYEMATWSTPEVRQALLAEQQAEEARRAHEAAQKAKAAAVQVRGAPVAGASQAPNPNDRRAMIAAAMDGARV